MTPVNQAMPQSMGLGQIDHMPSRLGQDFDPQRSHHIPTDDVRLSDRARSFVATPPIDLPSPDRPGGDNGLATSIRKVGQFLKEHPEIAQSSFGKSVQTLMRGAVHLAKAGDVGGVPPDAKQNLLKSVHQVKHFMENHPRVAESPFGQAVANMGKAIISTIRPDGGDPGSALKHKIVHAAKQAHRYLEAHPKIAEMPLGLAVEKLINGVRAMGEGTHVDQDIHNLAKRISHYVGHHPRLADSEFGQLAANLARGILALDNFVPPDVEPPVVGDISPDVAVPVASEANVTADSLQKADLQKAA